MDGSFAFNYHLSPATASPYYASLPPRSKPKVTGQQRKAANERERKRMNSINKGFETLRDRLPVPNNDRKLSKVDTLKFAMNYIEQLKKLLEEPGEKGTLSKVMIESNGEENPPSIYMVSWRKLCEPYGQTHPSPAGPIVFQKNIWSPSEPQDK